MKEKRNDGVRIIIYEKNLLRNVQLYILSDCTWESLPETSL